MNRVIKFRAWDIWLKEFVEATEHDPFGYYNTGVVFKNAPEKKIVLQQYTGLKDMEGKEIYEGDIIQFQKSLLEFEVEFRNYEWLLISIYKEPYSMNKFLHESIKVIGNIFENPVIEEEK